MNKSYITARKDGFPISGGLVVQSKPIRGIFARALVGSFDIVKVTLKDSSNATVTTVTQMIADTPLQLQMSLVLKAPIHSHLTADPYTPSLNSLATASANLTTSKDTLAFINDVFGWLGEFRLVNDMIYVRHAVLQSYTAPLTIKAMPQ